MSIEFTPDVGFSFKSKGGSTLSVKYPFPLPAKQALVEDNQIYLLWAKDHKESQIVPVKIKGKTCG